MEILKAVELPKKRTYAKQTDWQEYPFRDLSVGDSFVLLIPKGEHHLSFQSRVSAACSYYGRRWGKTFTTRCLDDGVGIWRSA